jgi:hypothetical protein
VEFSLDFWPVVVMTLHGTLNAEAADQMAAAFVEALSRRSTMVHIVDARGVSERPDALVRRKLADYITRSRDPAKQFSLGTVIVVNNALLRSAITAIHWVAPSPVPTVATETMEEAVEQCATWLRSNRVSVSAELLMRLKQHVR